MPKDRFKQPLPFAREGGGDEFLCLTNTIHAAYKSRGIEIQENNLFLSVINFFANETKKIPDEGVQHWGTSVRGLGVNPAPNAIQKQLIYLKY